ncbi:hypothetical protein CKO42_05660 [Lamprobacter modestohalophilus]|uniref:DUF4340 domain-containing protein n=1 Tax=Lamprobacter modestohalophilus TaxID=1064514 RepID=A0A9X0W6N7_9GAMM|nr:DUF4340 domain-containing protein [Lamprobacter modestohalophilus]MBK1617948.1 hypothetical protein [Lamprobacter modestohalophilus]
MSDRPNWLAQRFRNPLSGLEPSWRRALQTPAVSALIALLVAQLVAALVLAGNAMQTSSAADAPLLNLVSDQVKRIEIDSADEQVVLARAAEGWVLPALADFPADADKVDRLLSTLTALQRPLPVGASGETQRRLKVADDNAERRITLYGNTGNTGDTGDTGHVGELTQLLTGDSRGFRRLYARLADEDTVYDLPLANVLIASDSGDWLRRDQLHLDAGAIERVHSDDWTLSRMDGSWRLTAALADRMAGTPTSAPAPELERMELDHREREGTERESSEREDAGRENTGREGAGREDKTLEGAGLEPTGLDQAEPNPTKMRRSDLDSSQVEALLSRIANLSYEDVRMPATAAALTSEPVLRLDITLDDGSRRSRMVFADGNGSYLLQTGTDPWLYELSEYDLDGLLGLDPQQLLARQADQSAQAEASHEMTPSAELTLNDSLAAGDELAPSAEPNPLDTAGKIPSHSGNGSAATVEKDLADGAGPVDRTDPADGAGPADGTDPTVGIGSSDLAEPIDDRQTDELGGAAISESPAPSADLDRGTGSATEPTTTVGDSSAAEANDAEQPEPAAAATASEGPSESVTHPATSPAETEPDFRPQQRPVPARSAPPQWPYQRYAPPSGQPWPPQGPPPQAAPGWR